VARRGRPRRVPTPSLFVPRLFVPINRAAPLAFWLVLCYNHIESAWHLHHADRHQMAYDRAHTQEGHTMAPKTLWHDGEHITMPRAESWGKISIGVYTTLGVVSIPNGWAEDDTEDRYVFRQRIVDLVMADAGCDDDLLDSPRITVVTDKYVGETTHADMIRKAIKMHDAAVKRVRSIHWFVDAETLALDYVMQPEMEPDEEAPCQS